MELVRASVTLVVALSLLLGGCSGLFGVEGSGTSKTEQRQVAPFERVEASGAIDVTVSAAERATCLVSGDDNIVPLVQTTIRGSTLEIRTEKQVRPKIPLKVRLTTPTLVDLALSGACEGDVRGLKGERLGVHLSGAGEIDLADVHFERLDIDISGAGEAAASGTARKLVFEVSGAGDAKLGALCTEEAQVHVSGAGSAEVAVAKTLTAEISGAGSVGYLGDPAVSRDVSGAGSVTRIGPLPLRCSTAIAPVSPAD
jgi:hypothetical protein